MLKQCAVCSASFEANHHRKTICSPDCVDERNRIKAREGGLANKEKVRKSNQLTQRKRIENGKFRQYQLTRRSSKAGYLDRFLERARMVNPSTDLTREYLDGIFGDKCSVTGVPFCFDRAKGTGFKNPFAPSIDRINSALPYQTGNIQVVLTAVNFAKNEMSMEDFTLVWQHISKSWAALTKGAY